MKKILIVGAIIIALGAAALHLYPSYRAPKAHTIIETQLTSFKQQVENTGIAEVTIKNHETNDLESTVELDINVDTEALINSILDFQITPSSELQQPLHMTATLTTLFGALPSRHGFESIHTVIESPELSKALAKLGETNGLTLDCTTYPQASMYITKCATNSMELINPDKTEGDIDAESIRIDPVSLDFNLDKGNTSIESKITIPQFTVVRDGDVIMEMNNIQSSTISPIVADSLAETLNLILGKVIRNGVYKSEASFGNIAFLPSVPEKSLIIDSIQTVGESSVIDGHMDSEFKITAGPIMGTDVTFHGMEIAASGTNINTNALIALSRAYNSASLSEQGQEANPLDMLDEVTDLTAELLSKGVTFGMAINLAKTEESGLKIDSHLKFAETDKAAMAQSLNRIINTPQNPTAVMDFLTQFTNIDIQAKSDMNFFETIAMTVINQKNKNAALSEEEQTMQIAQALTMLEMFGVIKKDNNFVTSRFQISESGVFLNEKDVGPLLGIMPEHNKKATEQKSPSE